MASYKLFLTIKIDHEYYNSFEGELAPVSVMPTSKTHELLKQYNMLIKSQPGKIEIIVETERFEDLVDTTEHFNAQFMLTSLDPIFRSITKMPNSFDIADIRANLTNKENIDIDMSHWVTSEKEENNNSSLDSSNLKLIGLLNIEINKPLLTLKPKAINIHFLSISTYWKYYIFSYYNQKDLEIINIKHNEPMFTKFESEIISNKKAHVFSSIDAIPLRKAYSEYYSLLSGTTILHKCLPIPNPNHTSTEIIDNQIRNISDIYIN